MVVFVCVAFFPWLQISINVLAITFCLTMSDFLLIDKDMWCGCVHTIATNPVLFIITMQYIILLINYKILMGFMYVLLISSGVHLTKNSLYLFVKWGGVTIFTKIVISISLLLC